MELRKTYRVGRALRRRLDTGDRDGEITETGVVPEAELELPTGEVRQRPPAYSAVKVGGVRAYKRARRGEEVEMPERQVTVHRFEQLWRDGRPGGVRDRVLLGHLRPQPDRRPRRRLLRRAAPDRDRPVRGRRGRRGSLPLADALGARLARRVACQKALGRR